MLESIIPVPEDVEIEKIISKIKDPTSRYMEYLRLTSKPPSSNVLLDIPGRLPPGRQGTLPDVLFGKTNRDVSVLLVSSPSPEILLGIDGIIGITALKAHRINFDFAGRTLSWS